MEGTYQQLFEQVKVKSGLTEEEVTTRIAQKQQELYGLLSKEGALHIMANECGISIKEFYKKTVPLARLVQGMRFSDVEGVVTRIYEPKKFEKNGRQGKVGGFLLQDDTGRMRVVVWNEQTNLLLTLHEGDHVTLHNARVHARQDGAYELHVLATSRLVTQQKAVLPKILAKLRDNDTMVSTYGTIVALHDLRYFEQCELCKKRLTKETDVWVCQKHGKQQPHYGYLLTLILDDGTATMRVLFFGQLVEQLLGLKENQVHELRENNEHLAAIRKQLLGKTIMLVGNVRKNNFFVQLEFHATQISFPRAQDVLAHLDALHILR